MADDTELPDEVALLWGLRGTARRGPKPALTVHDITRAAVEVADAEGLSAVSMSRVAAQLGNSTMALYRHVRSKDELLALMADFDAQGPPDAPADLGWRDGLQRWAEQAMARAKRHPWLAQIPVGAPPLGPTSLIWFDRALGTLSRTGLSEPDKVGVVLGLLTFVQGESRSRFELGAGYAAAPEAFGRRYGELLRRLVDPRRLPALSAVVAAGVFDQDDLLDEADQDADFAFGLGLYLDGVEAFIARRTGTPPTG
jgi:AcrR family transcriptional regulator